MALESLVLLWPFVFAIIISEKGGAERREAFDKGEVTIGRVQGNDLMLPKGNVSKRHCRLERRDSGFVVVDQESTNGTYVNRRRITTDTPVEEGDSIYVGDFILRIEPEAEKSSEKDAAKAVDAPRSPMGTASDGESSPRGMLSTNRGSGETTSDRVRSGRDVDAMVDYKKAFNAIGSLLERVTSSLEPRLLEREPDPSLERRVERLVDDAYNELMIEGDIAQGVDEVKIKQAAVDELVRLGPLERLMGDGSVQEIAVSGPGHIAVSRAGHRSPRELPFCLPESIPRVIGRLCRRAGMDLPAAGSITRVMLPESSFELEMLGDAVLSGGALRLVRRDAVVVSLESLVRSGVISRTMATFLRHCVVARVNMLVVGATRSGASDVLAALSAAVEDERAFGLAGDESSAVVFENVTWLDPPETEAAAVLGCASNFAGHRLLIDDFGGERASHVLTAIGEGAQGVLGRVKARSIERGLNRLCAELSMKNPGVTPFVVAEALIADFDLALEVTRLPDGRSRVVRISELERGESGFINGNDVFDFSIERTATGGSIEGTFRSTGHRPQVAGELKNHGFRVDASLFSRPPTSEER